MSESKFSVTKRITEALQKLDFSPGVEYRLSFVFEWGKISSFAISKVESKFIFHSESRRLRFPYVSKWQYGTLHVNLYEEINPLTPDQKKELHLLNDKKASAYLFEQFKQSVQDCFILAIAKAVESLEMERENVRLAIDRLEQSKNFVNTNL